jgi:hypothetical protein
MSDLTDYWSVDVRPPCYTSDIQTKRKVVNMTTLTETLFSTIVHDYHNGGVKSSYGLDAYTRKEILTYLIRSKGCQCINCLDKENN